MKIIKAFVTGMITTLVIEGVLLIAGVVRDEEGEVNNVGESN